MTVSIEPLRYVVERIGGERVEVKTLLPRGASPETYEPGPAAMAALSESRALLRLGALGFEQTALPRLAEGSGTELVSLWKDTEGGKEEHAAAQEAHATAPAHHHPAHDPHVWTSPAALTAIARAAAKELSRLDPEGAAEYEKNLEAFTQEMQALDAELQRTLTPARGRAFVIYHPALGQFAAHYGLRQLAVEADGKEPSAPGLKALTDQARAARVDVVFISEEHAGTLAQRLAETLGARVVNINPLAYDVPAQLRTIANELTRNGK